MQNEIQVLVIDDDPSEHFLVEQLFYEAKGEMSVTCVSSINDGVEHIRHSSVDVVLLDLILGETNGLITLRRFKELVSDVPVIVLSSVTDESIALSAVEDGAQDYITKDDLSFRVIRRSIRHAMQRHALQTEIEVQALRDVVTGLPNRARFDQDIRAAIENASSGCQFAVIFIDIDEFKLVNDTHGHSTGDRLLMDFAGRLLRSLRRSDKAARFGGDEFVVLLTDIDCEKDVLTFVERLQNEIARPFAIERQEYFVSASMGIVLHDPKYITSGAMLRDADTAMYRAKADGKSCYRWFCQSMRDLAVEKLGIEAQLRNALINEEFELFYQPILELSTRRVMRFEALLRWRHPVKGILTPDHVIPAAESMGLIVPIGKWVLDTACKQLSRWHREFDCADVGVAVNVSPIQLLNPEFVEDVFSAIHDANVAPENLELEVTESCIMTNPAVAHAALRELRAAGVSISIDDFGTGYSSLKQLYEFSYDVLKIDRSFIRAMMDEGDGFVRAILVLSESLGLDIVAEGVEYEEQVNRLMELGCPSGQGYLFDKPFPAAQAIKYLADRSESPNSLVEQE